MTKINNMSKKNKILAGVGIIAAVLAIYFIVEHLLYVSTDNAQVEAHSMMLASKVPGFVVKVNVLEGQKVKKDDVLVEIDERDYQNTLKQVKGELTAVQARMVEAEKTYKRMASLYSSGSISQQQYDSANASYSDVKARYEGVSAQVSQAELNLENTKVKAPLDGFIAKKSVEAGQLVAGGVPLIGFIGSEGRWIVANFKETEIEGIKAGSASTIKVDAISGKTFHGTVESLSSATGATFTLLPPDNATGNFTKVVQRVPVRIKINDITENDMELLRAGLSADVKVRKN